MRLHHFRRAMREARAVAGQTQSRTGYYLAGALLAGLAAIAGYELLKPKSGAAGSTLPPLPTTSPGATPGPPPNPPATPVNPQTGVPGIWPSAPPPATPPAAPTDPVADSSLQAAAQAALNMLARQSGSTFNPVDVATLKSQGATDAQIAPLVQQEIQGFQQSVASGMPNLPQNGQLDYLTLAAIFAQAVAVASISPSQAQPNPPVTDPAMVGLAQQALAKATQLPALNGHVVPYSAPSATSVANGKWSLGDPNDPTFLSAIQSFQQYIGSSLAQSGALDLGTWAVIVSMAFGK